VYASENPPKFQRNISLPFSGPKNKPNSNQPEAGIKQIYPSNMSINGTLFIVWNIVNRTLQTELFSIHGVSKILSKQITHSMILNVP
jgi:hypothetical protein